MKSLRQVIKWTFVVTVVGLCSIMAVSVANTIASPHRNEDLTTVKTTPWPFDPPTLEGHLSQFLKIPTISTDHPAERNDESFKQAVEFLSTTYPVAHEKLGIKMQAGFTLVGHWPGQDPSLKPVLLMAHYDVVPVTNQNWSRNPFGGEIDEDFIYGRGAIDDKSSVLGILEAVEMAIKQGFQPQRGIYLVLGHNEEVGGEGGAKQVAADFKSSNLEFEFVLDEGGIVTEGSKLGISKNVALIGIAEKGYMDLELVAKGVPGHSSMPGPETAIGRLARAIHRIETNPFPTRFDGSVFAMTLESLIPYAPFVQKWAASNLWLSAPLITAKMSRNQATNAFLRTAQSFTLTQGGTKANVLPAEARANLNLRLLPGDTLDWAESRVRQLVEDLEVEVKQANPPLSLNASPISPTEAFGFRLIGQAIRTLDPSIVPIPYLVLGATDSRHFRDLSPNIYRFLFASMFADEISWIHGVDERIRRSDYQRAVRFYSTLLQNL